MYELYIGNKHYSTWSLRPWVLMTTLQIPFEERLVPFQDRPHWERFREFSPTGKVPCLHDGSTVVWESTGIMEYLAERHAGVWPDEAAARAWARCATAEMHAGFPNLRMECPMAIALRVRLHDPSVDLFRDIERIGELWNQGLARFGGPFLAGPCFGAVDAIFAPVAFRVQTYGLALAGAAREYAARMLELPSMRRWQADALQESWREEKFETSIQTSGELLADLRDTTV